MPTTDINEKVPSTPRDDRRHERRYAPQLKPYDLTLLQSDYDEDESINA
jgi:hypothetical protein